jgi:RNA ligase
MFTLSDARWAVQNKPEFGVYEREFGTVIDYNISLEGTFVGQSDFDTMILKNLRGTCFDQSGRIISLSFDKFHNLNECDGWYDHQIDFSQSHTVLEKLDGSMVRAIPMPDGSYRLGTRAGVTEVAVKAENFLKTLSPAMQQNYDDFIKFCLEDQHGAICTPIFEYCSRDQRIVLDYAEPQLVLTAVRNTVTGKYFPYSELVAFAKAYELPVVQPMFNDQSSFADLSGAIRGLIGKEGVVVVFENGFRVKIKAEDYCLKHRALDGLRFEKDVLQLVLKGELDDVLPLVTDDVHDRLIRYRESVFHRLEVARQEMFAMFERHRGLPTKKQFAEMVMQSPYKTGLFKMWDGHEYKLSDYVLTKCGSQTAVDEVRWLIGKAYNEF